MVYQGSKKKKKDWNIFSRGDKIYYKNKIKKEKKIEKRKSLNFPKKDERIGKEKFK